MSWTREVLEEMLDERNKTIDRMSAKLREAEAVIAGVNEIVETVHFERSYECANAVSKARLVLDRYKSEVSSEQS